MTARDDVLLIWLGKNECSLDWAVSPRYAPSVETIEQWRTPAGVAFIVLHMQNGGWELLTAPGSNDVALTFVDAEMRLGIGDVGDALRSIDEANKKDEYADLGDALRFIDAKNAKNPNACTDVYVDFARGGPARGMWGASGIFAHRAGVSLSSAIESAARALGWKGGR